MSKKKKSIVESILKIKEEEDEKIKNLHIES